jgi:uncharacterized protein (DUF488 family)
MQTVEFSAALEDLIELGKTKSIAIMCAEAVPWRCHRSLIADALTVKGVNVEHIFSETQRKPHSLTPFLKANDELLSYPDEGQQQVVEKQQQMDFNATAPAVISGAPRADRNNKRPRKSLRSPAR